MEQHAIMLAALLLALPAHASDPGTVPGLHPGVDPADVAADGGCTSTATVTRAITRTKSLGGSVTGGAGGHEGARSGSGTVTGSASTAGTAGGTVVVDVSHVDPDCVEPGGSYTHSQCYVLGSAIRVAEAATRHAFDHATEVCGSYVLRPGGRPGATPTTPTRLPRPDGVELTGSLWPWAPSSPVDPTQSEECETARAMLAWVTAELDRLEAQWDRADCSPVYR